MFEKIKNILALTCVTIVGTAIASIVIHAFVVVIPEKCKGIAIKDWGIAFVMVMVLLLIISAFQWSIIYLSRGKG